MKKHFTLLLTLLFLCIGQSALFAQNCTPNTPCDDGNDCTINDTFDDNCFCSGITLDTDNDGSPDCFDLCPEDPNKVLPGACGCGVADEDRDGDFQVDCFDQCPDDPNKILPGICGCGVADADMDGDTVVDCIDLCPNSTINVDSDGDGVCDEFDECPGGDDNIDNNNNGTPDACENCDPIVGSPCDDNNDCTTDDRIVGNCNCTGTLMDADGDTVCDMDDQCPNGDDRIDNNGNGIPDACETGDTGITVTNCPSDIRYTVPYDFGLQGDDVSWPFPEATTTCPDGQITFMQNGQVIVPGPTMTFISTESLVPVTYDISDNCGNTATCSFEIFLDSEIGVFFCPSDVTFTAEPGASTALAFWNSDPVGETSCSRGGVTVSQTEGLAQGSQFPIGVTPITFVLTDNCENSVTCSFNVTVLASDCTIGDSCDDGNACTTNDILDTDCNCAGTFADSDNDGVCDVDDICANGDDTVDSDGDGTPDACDDDNGGGGDSTDCPDAQPWEPCDDGNPCTIEDEITEDCECRGIYQDTDSDGVCDADDICPGGNDYLDTDGDGTPDFCDTNNGCNPAVGTTCDDGNSCTTNDVIGEDCACVGTFADSDGDGVCDADDICQGGDDNIDTDGDGTPDVCDTDDCPFTVGTLCDDGNPCTGPDRYTEDCDCVGQFKDADGDGVCDADDICEGGDDAADIDSDGIPDACDTCDTQIGTTCDDGNVCTINDTFDTNCNCIGTYQDSDGDGVCDADDICQGGDDNIDTDGDGTPDFCDIECAPPVGATCDDGNPMTTHDIIDEDCNCIGVMLDSDLDGVLDKDDKCMGGDDSLDVDGDGIPDYCDQCNDCPTSLDITCVDIEEVFISEGHINVAVDLVMPNIDLQTCTACSHLEVEGFQLLGMRHGHRYYISNNRMMWWKAADLAAVIGGYLAVIETAGENEFLTEAIQNVDVTAAFIGLHDRDIEGIFAWYNGTPLDYTNWNQPLAEMNTEERDAVRLLNNGGWDVYSNTMPSHYILELPCVDLEVVNSSGENGIYPLGRNIVTLKGTSICGDVDECSYILDVKTGEVDQFVASERDALRFYATVQTESVDLNWVVNNSFKTRRYRIERSTNNVDFKEVAWLNNVENSHAPVGEEWTDNQPVDGQSFYRIKQVFNDGTHKFSPVIIVDFKSPSEQFDVYPNPAQGQVAINLRTYAGKSATIQVYNHFGQLTLQKELAELSTSPVELTTANFQDGIYRIVIFIPGHRMLSKNFVVSKLD